MNGAQLARGGAILIALAAAIDPSWTRSRIVPVPIAVMHDGRSAAYASQLRRELAGEFALVDGGAPSSEGTLLLRGRDAPLPPVPQHGPVFVADDPSRMPPLRIRAIDPPRIALAGRAVDVRLAADAVETLAGAVSIELRSGAALLAREERPAGQRGRFETTLRFVAPRAGILPLDVTVRSGDLVVRAGTAVRIEDRKLQVLFIDPRPSWSSTFVRRALEEDPAVGVSTETTVSRGVSVTSGNQTARFAAADHDAIDAIVAGTPSALQAAQVAALESFARTRGGTVVLLADGESSQVLSRLTGAGPWRLESHRQPLSATGPHGTFQVSETLTLVTPAIEAAALARAGEPAEPIVQEFATGNGRFIVSGAVDAWRYRGASGSAFAQFWRGVISDAALAATQPVSVTVSPARANPAQTVQVDVAVRDAAGAVAVEGTLDTGGRREPIRLWPASMPGVFTARIAAPATEGVSRILVAGTAGGRAIAGETQFVVSASEPLANVPMGVPIVLMSAREGAYVPDGAVTAVRNALRPAFPEHRADVTVHPMRYAWWIAPFTLLLGYEWRWRRRRGLK